MKPPAPALPVSAAAVILIVAAHPLSGQELGGQLLDADSETAIPTAEVSLLVEGEESEALKSVVTDSAGSFTFSDVPPGRYRLRSRMIGYLDVLTPPFDLIPTEALQVELRASASAVPLAPLEVVARRPPRRSALRLVSAGYYERKDSWGDEGLGLGYFMDLEDLDMHPASRTSDFFRELRGVRVEAAGATQQRILMRPHPGDYSGCDPAVYIDGGYVRLYPGDSLDGLVSALDVSAIEVYPGINKPGRFSGQAPRPCGAIVIWTGGRR